MWCPATAPMVDTALMLRALTSGPPPVTLRTATSASKRRTVSTRRAAGRACSPWALCSATSTLAAGGGVISVDTGIPALSSLALISAVLAASVAASASVAPPAAETTAATRPSTIGASDSTIGGASSPASSTASSALSTALPRSISTSTPSGVRGPLDGLPHGGGVGAQDPTVEPGGDLDRRARPVHHLHCQLDGGFGQPATVGDDDDADHDVKAVAVAASRSSAADVAPGSWWPALRSPR